MGDGRSDRLYGRFEGRGGAGGKRTEGESQNEELDYFALLANWCAAGFSPADFWEQSVATFNAAMKGAAERRLIDPEIAIATAWWTAYLRGRKRVGPLGKYLKMIRGGEKSAASKAAEIVAAFKSMEGRGLAVKVKRIPREE